MRSLCPNEIVAPVVRWSHDHIVSGQPFERVLKNRTRQVWAVAVESDNASLITLCEMRKYRSEARSKAFTFLRNYVHFVSSQLRQLVSVGVRTHDGNFYIAQ